MMRSVLLATPILTAWAAAVLDSTVSALVTPSSRTGSITSLDRRGDNPVPTDWRPWYKGGPWRSWLSCPSDSWFQGTFCLDATTPPVSAFRTGNELRMVRRPARKRVDDSQLFVTHCKRARPDAYRPPAIVERYCPTHHHCEPHGERTWRPHEWDETSLDPPPMIVCVPDGKYDRFKIWRKRPDPDADYDDRRMQTYRAGQANLLANIRGGSSRIAKMSFWVAMNTGYGTQRSADAAITASAAGPSGGLATFSALLLDPASRAIKSAVKSISATLNGQELCHTGAPYDPSDAQQIAYSKHVCMPTGAFATSAVEAGDQVEVSVELETMPPAGSLLSWSLLGVPYSGKT